MRAGVDASPGWGAEVDDGVAAGGIGVVCSGGGGVLASALEGCSVVDDLDGPLEPADPLAEDFDFLKAELEEDRKRAGVLGADKFDARTTLRLANSRPLFSRANAISNTSPTNLNPEAGLWKREAFDENFERHGHLAVTE